MMNNPLLDLYSDYLISSFSYTTATGLSRLLDNQISHDKITRFLSEHLFTSSDLWKLAKPVVREIESPEGIIIIDETIEHKPYTDENELVTWHYDHTQGRMVKGIQLISALYAAGEVTLPVAFDTVRKTETVTDQKTGQSRKKSPVTLNDRYRLLLQACVSNQIPFKYVLNDVWYASAENMKFIKQVLNKDFVMPIKSNRKIALSSEAKRQGAFQAVQSLSIEPTDVMTVYLEGVDFPLHLIKQVFTNEDTSHGILYLLTSDLTLSYDAISSLYQKRWKVEVYHKSLKSNAALALSPTKTVLTQTNHLFASLCAFIKLEMLKVKTAANHFALKSKLYLKSLQSAFHELQILGTQKLVRA